MSGHSSTGQIRPLRIPVPHNLGLIGTGITQESILRSRISEMEAQVENLKAQLRELKK